MKMKIFRIYLKMEYSRNSRFFSDSIDSSQIYSFSIYLYSKRYIIQEIINKNEIFLSYIMMQEISIL